MTLLQEIIHDLEAQICYEHQRVLSMEDKARGWSEEYHAGYIDGITQAVACMRMYNNIEENK